MNAMQQLLTEHIAIWTAADTEKKSGRGRASGNAGSVYGIKKLRELILELAVRGKLVPQDNSNASDNHKFAKLGDIVEVLDSLRKPVTKQDRVEGPYPYYGASCIVDYVASYIFDEPLVLVGEDGAKWGVGENTAFMIEGKTWVNNHAHVIRPNRQLVTDKFLTYCLVAMDLNEFITGMTVPKLNQTRLVSIEIPLPSLAEQDRIVAKVDELMALCDQLEAQHSNAAEAHEKLVSHLLGTITQSQSVDDFNVNWQRIYAHFDTLFTTEASIDALKQTLLQLAVMGKLVPQDPNDEPASELLKRIQAEKAQLVAEGKIKKEKLFTPIGDDEKPFELPNAWEFARLSNVATLENGDRGKNYPNKDALVQEGVPFVNAGHLENGVVNKLEMTFITEQRYDVLSGGKFIEEDILFCLRGSLGKCAVVKDIPKGAIASSLVIIRVNPNITLNYFYNYLISNLLMQSVKKYDNGTAQPNLSSADLAKFVVPIPPVDEQHRIVAKIDELMTLCDQLKTRIQQANQQQQVIADVLVAQALN